MSHSTKTPEDCKTWFVIFFLSRILWLQVVKSSNIRHFPFPSRVYKCCDSCSEINLFFSPLSSYYLSSLVKKGVPCVWDISCGRGSSPLTLAEGPNSVAFLCIKSEFPGQPRGGVRGLQMTNEIQICFSNTKPYKNEVQMRFSKWCENEKRNSYLFFNVMRKRKTKNGNGIWIPFSHAIEKRLALRYTHSTDPFSTATKTPVLGNLFKFKRFAITFARAFCHWG